MNCYNCNKKIENEWAVCPHCQAPLHSGLGQKPNPYAAPAKGHYPYANVHDANDNEGDATGGLIPYKNPKALIAYYLGILSGLPLLGFPLGIAAFTLGIMGLKDRKKNPVIKGGVHAGIGIGCGGLFALLWGLGIVSLIANWLFLPS